MKVEIKIETKPKTETINDFAVRANRKRTYINRACEADLLNYGFLFSDKDNKGVKLVVLDKTAKEFVKRCQKLDKDKL